MIEEKHIETKRTARYYLHGEPGPEVTDLWIACHGYGQLGADFVKEFDCIAAPERVVVVPEATSRFYLTASTGYHGPDTKVGATWMTREDRETDIADYVAYVDTLYDAIVPQTGSSPRITMLGFSQGGATAHRWLSRTSRPVHRLIMWGALLPQDADLAKSAELFRTVELTIVYGTKDQYADPEVISAVKKQFEISGIRHRVVTFDGGHRLDRDTLRNLAAPSN